jgi:hypothetical protein
MSTAKSLFIRRESGVWESLRSQWAALTEANERLAQQSAEAADLRVTPQVLPWLEHISVLMTVITCGRKLRRT